MPVEHQLPSLPAKHSKFLGYVEAHPNTPVVELIKPYTEYDATLRKLYAQEPSHPAIADNLANVVPLYDENGSTDVQIRARDLATESEEVKLKYLMPLKDCDRKANGSAAFVPTLKEFQNNFNIFCESSLSDLDWSNVVVSGSAVTTCVLSVPEKHADSKRSLRQFYHEQFAPASDVDLFIYGLTEEKAIEKIKQIETRIKDSILHETTTIRTKNAITIVSQYPTRHIQIVLRLYKSISEILTGFDVDCSCAAYDGRQVYLSPRAVGAFITQTNQIDLSRRSPSYENRLSKYSHRGFEVFWPGLDRSCIDPTIFERSFTRTVGLARLLVLEKLPKASDREAYLNQRRVERGRPALNTYARRFNKLNGNIKDDWNDEVPEWLEEDEVSNYHTFTIPYGVRFHARRIERLLFTKDLLLNAEWNKPKDRTVNLHRHPAFFGNFEDVIRDCCGYCPNASTEEDQKVAEEEDKIYVKGEIAFLKDNPGRQEIGSFNPITETDWTEMAYVGNTETLCQAIVDGDIERVKEWLLQEGSDPNRRDYTGRTPLHLAVVSSSPEAVQCLVDHGARLIARLADGRTTLHLAAARGNVEIIQILLTKSAANEEDEAQKDQALKKVTPNEEKEDEDGDVEMITNPSEEDDGDAMSYATGSFINVKKDSQNGKGDVLSGEANDLDPDIYDINVLAWDQNASPLHLAIANGHVDAVDKLVSSFGADVLLPIKLLNDYNSSPRAAILTLVLALRLPIDRAKLMTAKLLQLGASTAQADVQQRTPLHYVVTSEEYSNLLKIYIEHDLPAVQRAIDSLSVTGRTWTPNSDSVLTIAIKAKNVIGALKILETRAKPTIEFEQYMKSAQITFPGMKNQSSETNEQNFRTSVEQPVILAVQNEQPAVVLELLNRGVDPNTLSTHGQSLLKSRSRYPPQGASLLDCVREKLLALRQYDGEKLNVVPPVRLNPDDDYYIGGLQGGTYQIWTARKLLKHARETYKIYQEKYTEAVEKAKHGKGVQEKKSAVEALIHGFQTVEQVLITKGAKKFTDLHPTVEGSSTKNRSYPSPYNLSNVPGFQIDFKFRVPHIDNVKRDGYVKLFEAAWNGDLNTIKEMTFVMWGPEKKSLPLEIGITDNHGLSPFSVAVLRGHLEVAKAILVISQAQYKPKEKKQETFDIDSEDAGHDDCSDYSDSNDDDDDGDSDNVRITRRVIDEEFTIDDVGEIKTQVESEISPLRILTQETPVYEFIAKEKLDKTYPSSLIDYAIFKDEPGLLCFLLDLGKDMHEKFAKDTSDPIYTVPEASFLLAMRLSRLGCLKELIRSTGAGLPLAKLEEKSGTEIKEKPKYYQGLSVHGKKRADWAAASRGIAVVQPRDTHPPLLLAAREGNLETVEWFLGTAPSRYYMEFAATYKDDKRLKRLDQSEGGIEQSITKWLTSRSDLVLHCTVLGKTKQAERLVEYLLKTAPQYMQVKSVFGYTPLSLAFLMRRPNFAKMLIAAGADQTVRDKNGSNILHLLFRSHWIHSDSDLTTLKDMFSLVDPLLVSSLLLERSSLEPGSLTPLAQWMCTQPNSYNQWGARNNLKGEDEFQLAVLKVILDFAEGTNQRHLEVLNGAGNSLLHEAVRWKLPKTLHLMLERRPDLLYRENATGFTPNELAEVAWVSEVTSNPPEIPGDNSHSYRRDLQPIVNREPESFANEPGKSPKRNSDTQAVYELCSSRDREEGARKKRKLVSLFDANEVAKRLAVKQTRPNHRNSEVKDDEEEVIDEVQVWLQGLGMI